MTGTIRGMWVALVVIAEMMCASATTAQMILVTTLNDRADPPFDQYDASPFALYCGFGSIQDLPGGDGEVSLREAIIAANNTPGPQTIAFAPSLRGGTIHLTFDTLDDDSDVDPFPFLCNDGTTIDGDLDGDNAPDITLDGAAVPVAADSIDDGLLIVSSDNTINGLSLVDFPNGGIGAVQLSGTPPVARNRITHNVLRHVPAGIFVDAGLTTGLGAFAGVISDTTIAGNTVDSSSLCGICVETGDAATSSIDRTGIMNNRVSHSRYGVLVQANYPNGGADTSIRDTSILNNELFANTDTGILAFSFAGQRNTISHLVVRENEVHDNAVLGMSLVSGVCGAQDNSLDAYITLNTLRRNGAPDTTSGIFAAAGGNFQCSGPALPATGNHLDVELTHNTLEDEQGGALLILAGGYNANNNQVTGFVGDNEVVSAAGYGLAVIGGLGTVAGASDNAVSLDILRNTIRQNSGTGISILAAFAAGDSNDVTVRILENRLTQNNGGIGVFAGIANQGNSPTSSSVTATISGNEVCRNKQADISCGGGSQPQMPGSGVGTGLEQNEASGSIDLNTATVVDVNGGCTATSTNTRDCACPGDCNADGRTRVDELILSIRRALGSAAADQCPAADADFDDLVSISDLVLAVNTALHGCVQTPIL